VLAVGKNAQGNGAAHLCEGTRTGTTYRETRTVALTPQSDFVTMGLRTDTVPPRQAAARARRAKPGANAPPRTSEAQAAAGRITGGGGRAV
jgi:hypothetical protein